MVEFSYIFYLYLSMKKEMALKDGDHTPLTLILQENVQLRRSPRPSPLARMVPRNPVFQAAAKNAKKRFLLHDLWSNFEIF